ncbi:MAG: hypothetical protein Q4F53_00505 [Nesterenkonia sp.]|nr:hypothetical protein [Nesterenkonia sp.]
MITLYRRDPEQGWSYREAWYDSAAGEFVVHHGVVGTNGTVTAEQVTEQDADPLMEGFLARCAEDGYAAPTDEQLRTLRLALPLRGPTPIASERRNAESVHQAVLVQLAWRGLGALSDPEAVSEDDGRHALVMEARTVHRAKAQQAARAALRGSDVPASKVDITVR